MLFVLQASRRDIVCLLQQALECTEPLALHGALACRSTSASIQQLHCRILAQQYRRLQIAHWGADVQKTPLQLTACWFVRQGPRILHLLMWLHKITAHGTDTSRVQQLCK